MSLFSPNLFCWSIVIHNREFLISVDPNGASEWLELKALQKAGGDQHVSDFIGAIIGDQNRAKRAKHRADEFKIFTEPASNDLDFINYASKNHDNPDCNLDETLNIYFLKQFWDEVNPQLPNQIKKA